MYPVQQLRTQNWFGCGGYGYKPGYTGFGSGFKIKDPIKTDPVKDSEILDLGAMPDQNLKNFDEKIYKKNQPFFLK